MKKGDAFISGIHSFKQGIYMDGSCLFESLELICMKLYLIRKFRNNVLQDRSIYLFEYFEKYIRSKISKKFGLSSLRLLVFFARDIGRPLNRFFFGSDDITPKVFANSCRMTCSEKGI